MLGGLYSYSVIVFCRASGEVPKTRMAVTVQEHQTGMPHVNKVLALHMHDTVVVSPLFLVVNWMVAAYNNTWSPGLRKHSTIRTRKSSSNLQKSQTRTQTDPFMVNNDISRAT